MQIEQYQLKGLIAESVAIGIHNAMKYFDYCAVWISQKEAEKMCNKLWKNAYPNIKTLPKGHVWLQEQINKGLIKKNRTGQTANSKIYYSQNEIIKQWVLEHSKYEDIINEIQ